MLHWSSRQPTIALSSGEAELGGLTKGATHGIGLRSIADDRGIELQIVIKTDATAALGMARRMGVGKVRHLDTSLLWIQAKIKSGDLRVEKVEGSNNCADMLAKYVDRSIIQRHLSNMCMTPETGRADSAPQLVTSVNNIIDCTMFFPRLAVADVNHIPASRELSGADPRDWIMINDELVYSKPPNLQGGVLKHHC